MVKKLFLLAAFVLYCSASYAFDVPERLEFDLGWARLKAGSATLEIKKDGDGLKIVSTARSAGLVSIFYTVRDRVESLLSPSGLPFRYHSRLREGGYRRDWEFVFENDAGKVVHIDHLKEERLEFDVPEKIFDPLSAFYRIRTMDLCVWESVYVPVFDSKKIWDIEVKVLRRERLKTPLGTFDTIVVKPLMKTGGIFKKKGDIYIWLTDDERKIPVFMKSKVKIGSVEAVLVDWSY